jgi:chloramphenicol 3-O-phosphotransferase
MLVWQPYSESNFDCYSSSICVSEYGMLASLLFISEYTVTTSNSAIAVLLDNGNLVLRDQVTMSEELETKSSEWLSGRQHS